MTKAFATLLTLICLTSCEQKNQSQTISEQQQKIQELEQKLVESETANDKAMPNSSTEPADLISTEDLFSTYVFAVIKTEKGETVNSGGMPGRRKVKVNYVTSIEKIIGFDEEKSARFKDLTRKWAAMKSYEPNRIYGIDVKTYTTYSEASQARERINYDSEVSFVLPHDF